MMNCLILIFRKQYQFFAFNLIDLIIILYFKSTNFNSFLSADLFDEIYCLHVPNADSLHINTISCQSFQKINNRTVRALKSQQIEQFPVLLVY